MYPPSSCCAFRVVSEGSPIQMVAAPSTIRSSALTLETGHTIRMVLSVSADSDAPHQTANKRPPCDDRKEEEEEEEEEEEGEEVDQSVDAVLHPQAACFDGFYGLITHGNHEPCHGAVFAAVEVSDGPFPCTIECAFEAHSTVELSRLGQGLCAQGQGLGAQGQGLAPDDRSLFFESSYFEPFVHRYTEEGEQCGVSESIVDHDKYQLRCEGYPLPSPHPLLIIHPLPAPFELLFIFPLPPHLILPSPICYPPPPNLLLTPPPPFSHTPHHLGLHRPSNLRSISVSLIH